MNHTYQTIVQETQLDSFGHLNNAKYLELYEQARWDFLHQKKYGIDMIREEQKGPVVLSVEVRYLRELKARASIEIITEHKSYIGRIFVIKQKILNESKEVCSTATFTCGLFDMEKRKLILPTEKWLDALGIKWQKA